MPSKTARCAPLIEKHQDLPRLDGNILDAFVGFPGVFTIFSPQYLAMGLKSRSL